MDITSRGSRQWAAGNGHEGVVKVLLENGAEVEAKGGDGWAPLLVAARCGHEGVVKVLLENGTEVKAKNKDGWTPLLVAAYYRYEAVVKLLETE